MALLLRYAKVLTVGGEVWKVDDYRRDGLRYDAQGETLMLAFCELEQRLRINPSCLGPEVTVGRAKWISSPRKEKGDAKLRIKAPPDRFDSRNSQHPQI